MKCILRNKGFILIWLIIHYNLLGQSYDDSSKPDEWVRKYWYYKSRLNNDFVKVDKEAEGNGVLNVFFVRDDVYESFVKGNYDHFNYFSSGLYLVKVYNGSHLIYVQKIIKK